MLTEREVFIMGFALLAAGWSIAAKVKSDQTYILREQKERAAHEKVLEKFITNYEIEKARREEQTKTIAAQRGEIESLRALLASTSADKARGKIINKKEIANG